MDLLNLSKLVVSAFLLVIFITQCRRSLNTLLDPPIISQEYDDIIKDAIYPEITACYVSEENITNKYNNIVEAYKNMPSFSEAVFSAYHWDIGPNFLDDIENNTEAQWYGKFRVVGCYTVKSGQKSKPIGFKYPVLLHLNYSKLITNILLNVHQPGFMVLNTQKTFNGDIHIINLENYSKKHYFSVKVRKNEYLSQDGYKCDNDKGKTYTECQRDYFESKMKCRLPWDKPRSDIRLCDQPEDLTLYRELLDIPSTLSSKEILQKLQCTIPCTQIGYTLIKTTERTLTQPNNGSYNTIAMKFLLDDNVVPTKKERWMYTLDNFIADIGGYLGLLLGASVLQLYKAAVEMMRKMFERRSGRTRIV